jgi:ATP-binding cassette subfamily B protein
MQEKLDGMNTRVQQNLSGIRVVKAFVREQFESERFDEANRELTDIAVRAQKTFSLLMPAMALILNSIIVLILVAAPEEIAKNALEVGLVMAMIQYTMQLLMSLMMSAMVFFFISRAKPSAERILAVLNEKSDIVEKAGAYRGDMKGVVEFKNVSFAYPDGVLALKNISFRAEPGKTLAILGSTGSGKSTLVALIPRLYDVKEGSVLIDGIDVRDYEFSALRKRIGVVPQQPVLFSGTVAENIAYGRADASREEIEEAARAAQAEAFILRREGGYEALLGRKGVNLSGGQKQRLAIARALIMRPRILILDDATSAIDMATEAKIQATLRESYGDLTRIVIAQRVSAVQDVDTILMMENGAIVASGSHKELYDSCEAYRELVYSQGAMLESEAR